MAQVAFAPRHAQMLLAVAIGFSLAGSASCTGRKDYDPQAGRPIANAIDNAKAPWVERVSYIVGDSVDPSYINIEVALGTPDDQMRTFSCRVIRPILTEGSPPADLGIYFVRGPQTLEDYSAIDC